MAGQYASVDRFKQSSETSQGGIITSQAHGVIAAHDLKDCVRSWFIRRCGTGRRADRKTGGTGRGRSCNIRKWICAVLCDNIIGYHITGDYPGANGEFILIIRRVIVPRGRIPGFSVDVPVTHGPPGPCPGDSTHVMDGGIQDLRCCADGIRDQGEFDGWRYQIKGFAGKFIGANIRSSCWKCRVVGVARVGIAWLKINIGVDGNRIGDDGSCTFT